MGSTILTTAASTGSSGTGTNGSVWHNGAGVPENSLGADGDYYLNNANADVYLRTTGIYAVVANIKGLTGAQGIQGATGATGNTSATATPFTPAGNIAATNVQAALVELDTEKAPLVNPDFTGGTPLVPKAPTDTNTTQAASTSFVLSQAATTAPLNNGVAAVGTSLKFARADHVHPVSAVSIDNFIYAVVQSKIKSKGYVLGGYTTSAVSNEIDGIDFYDKTSINPIAALTIARYSLSGISSSIKGLGLGGYGASTEIDGITFSDETVANPISVLPNARSTAAGTMSSTKGYLLWGGLTTSVGFLFSSETVFTPAATVPVTRYEVAGVSSVFIGYALGGDNPTYSAKIDGITFSSESYISFSATLATARKNAAGMSSPIRGYTFGGTIAAAATLNEIDGINYSDNTAINPSASLNFARGHSVGVSSVLEGACSGGDGTAIRSSIEGFNFSTESILAISATLTSARHSSAGVQSS